MFCGVRALLTFYAYIRVGLVFVRGTVESANNFVYDRITSRNATEASSVLRDAKHDFSLRTFRDCRIINLLPRFIHKNQDNNYLL